MSQKLQGRKNPWNMQTRQKRPKVIYIFEYVFQLPTNEIITIASREQLKSFLQNYNKDKIKTQKINIEKLISNKQHNNVLLLEINQINIEQNKKITKWKY